MAETLIHQQHQHVHAQCRQWVSSSSAAYFLGICELFLAMSNVSLPLSQGVIYTHVPQIDPPVLNLLDSCFFHTASPTSPFMTSPSNNFGYTSLPDLHNSHHKSCVTHCLNHLTQPCKYKSATCWRGGLLAANVTLWTCTATSMDMDCIPKVTRQHLSCCMVARQDHLHYCSCGYGSGQPQGPPMWTHAKTCTCLAGTGPGTSKSTQGLPMHFTRHKAGGWTNNHNIMQHPPVSTLEYTDVPAWHPNISYSSLSPSPSLAWHRWCCTCWPGKPTDPRNPCQDPQKPILVSTSTGTGFDWYGYGYNQKYLGVTHANNYQYCWQGETGWQLSNDEWSRMLTGQLDLGTKVNRKKPKWQNCNTTRNALEL